MMIEKFKRERLATPTKHDKEDRPRPRTPASVIDWCPRRDSNPEPTDYESAALTVELQGHNNLRAVDLRL
jgi:hypothetical protein